MAENLDLLQSELFTQAFKHAPIGMALVSTEGMWLQANLTLCQVIGYSESELITMTYMEITHPDDLDKCLDVTNRLLNGSLESFQMEKRYIHKNGFNVWVLVTLSVVRDKQGQPLFLMTQIRDITKLKLADEDLKAKTIQLESFIEYNADAIWMVDADDIIFEVNPAFETLFGWSPQEVKGKRLPIIPDFLQNFITSIHQRIKAGETVVGLETSRLRKDGTLVDVEASLSPLRDRNGNIIGITGICRDVTAKRRAELELKVKTDQLESFIQNNADAIWMVDANDIIFEVNPAFETLFGWSPQEVKGRKLPIIPDFLEDIIISIHQRIKVGETVVGLETLRQRKDGTLVDVEATLSPLRDRDGNIIGITGICRDVTAKKRAELELKAKTDQLESFIEHNTDAILIFNNTGILQRANKAFENIFGWSKDEVIGTELHTLHFIPDECLMEFLQLRDKVKNGQPLTSIETIRKHKNGQPVNVILTSSPVFDGKGNQNGWSVVLRDITEWKIAQEHLQNSEKLSVAGQLAAGIAHEIRNPITSIKGFIHLMKSGFGEKQKYFDIMTSEIDRIELILSELLILAKPQSIKYERKDIRVLLSQVTTLLDSQAILNNVQFITEFKPGVTHIYCDENQLKQVFINFLKNSIESMPKGGQITIQLESTDSEEMLIRINDQGCGIPKEFLKRLGQPFYTTKEKGTGLGFMVSKKIIENHAGKIHVESEVNKGTIIEVTLPVTF